MHIFYNWHLTLYFVHFRAGKKGGWLVGRLILAKIIFENYFLYRRINTVDVHVQSCNLINKVRK